MAISEQARYELYQRLSEVLDDEQATTLMEHLPPVGWADVATKHDLARTEELMKSELARVEAVLRGELAGVEGRTHRAIGQMLLASIAANTAVMSLLVAAVKLV